MSTPSSDIAFTPRIKSIQAERGSRTNYARMEERGGFRTELTEDLAQFLAGIDTAFLATANEAGQPYAQHRGGPKGFIRIIGPKTLAFADYKGNRQYITTGNLAENDRAFLFLMDYARRERLKLLGHARVLDAREHPDLADQLSPSPELRSKVEEAARRQAARIDISVKGARGIQMRITDDGRTSGRTRALSVARRLAHEAGLGLVVSTGKSTIVSIRYAIRRSTRR